MEIIGKNNLEELIGEEIAFIQAAQFAENITIATKDGKVLVVTQEIDFDFEEKRTRILNERQAIEYIENDDYIRKSLIELGIFDLEEYRKKKEKEEELKREKNKEIREERERKEYERLKAKFEK